MTLETKIKDMDEAEVSLLYSQIYRMATTHSYRTRAIREAILNGKRDVAILLLNEIERTLEQDLMTIFREVTVR